MERILISFLRTIQYTLVKASEKKKRKNPPNFINIRKVHRVNFFSKTNKTNKEHRVSQPLIFEI